MTWWIWLLLILFFMGIKEEKRKKERERRRNQAEREVQRRRKEAEDFIMSSGDPHAITMLMLARANPANYGQVLTGGMNKGNDTLKTALGVMTGVAAGNLVANAITASAISSALENMETNLASVDTGALDNFDTDIDFDF